MRRRLLPALVLPLGLVLASAPAGADVLVLKDGRTVDGKVLQERDGMLWVKTLEKVEKIPAASVASRTAGVSPVERHEELERAAEKDPKSAAAWWELHVFCARYPELAKDAKRALDRTLKIDPDHAQARDANGEVLFEGAWVRRSDLPRLQAEAELRRLDREWEARLGVPVELHRGEHWLLVDNTGDQDLSRRAQELDDAYARLAELLGVERFWDGQAPAITIAEHADYVKVIDHYQPVWKKEDWWLKAAKDPRNGGVWNHLPEPIQVRTIPSTGAEGMWAALVHMNAHVALWKLPRSKAPPAWLEEGLGAWVETEVRGLQMAFCIGTQGASGAATTDRRPGRKKQGAALSDAMAEYKERCIDAVQDGTFPPLRKFLRMELGEFGPAEEGASYGLVVWLSAKDPEGFRKLVRQLLAGAARDDDPWREAFGYELVEDVERDFKVWVQTEW